METWPGEIAKRNLAEAIRPGLRFPENVFTDVWSRFYFFDSDLIFRREDVNLFRRLMDTEGSSSVLLSLLGPELIEDNMNHQKSFVMGPRTGVDEYMSVLLGPQIGSGWLYGMYTFACISDAGQWCIYCEKMAELGVIAMRSHVNSEQFSFALHELKALPLAQALRIAPFYALSARLRPDWREKLRSAYGGAAD